MKLSMAYAVWAIAVVGSAGTTTAFGTGYAASTTTTSTSSCTSSSSSSSSSSGLAFHCNNNNNNMCMSFLKTKPGFTTTTTTTTTQLAFHRRGGGGDGGDGGDGRDDESMTTTSLSSSSSSSSVVNDDNDTTTTSTTMKWMDPDNLSLLSDRGRTALETLLDLDRNDQAQVHVYGNWPPPGTQDDKKQQLAEQLADLDASYPGGLASYLRKAKILLQESADGMNPFSDYIASVPEGEVLSFGDNDESLVSTMSFAEAEQLGKTVLSDVVFVLVAGGLGERLGYSGIKLSLETNLCTEECYLETYIKYILACQDMARRQTNDDSIVLPLVIMTSGDTDPMTRTLLQEHDNFGMTAPNQIQIVCQDKVPALKDGKAGLALEEEDEDDDSHNNRWKIQTKPHGHGDVHHLLYREGIVESWVKHQHKKYAVFLQDTNALVINSVIPTLGVSVKKKFHMNSICIPRLAGEAAGAITRLEHKTDPNKSLTINVEYNQLDPLLRTQGSGDVPDETTGYSPYPGNANNLVLDLEAYYKTLQGPDQGVVVEFVNPKYKDDTRTDFKKPTRLECMMQDIPKLFQLEMGNTANIGFTTFDRWFTFSPAKNALDAGIDAVANGSSAPGTMSSAESDKYIQNQRKLVYAGMKILKHDNDDDMEVVGGIPVTRGPRIYLSPSFAITQEEIVQKVSGGTLTQRSSLVLDGNGIVIQNMEVDGALVIRACPGAKVTVNGLKVNNKGWTLEEIPKGAENIPETVAIRGYTMAKHETTEFNITEPGKYVIGEDGICHKMDE